MLAPNYLRVLCRPVLGARIAGPSVPQVGEVLAVPFTRMATMQNRVFSVLFRSAGVGRTL